MKKMAGFCCFCGRAVRDCDFEYYDGKKIYVCSSGHCEKQLDSMQQELEEDERWNRIARGGER